MSNHPSRRGYFFTAMAGSLIGLMAGVLLVGMVPAVAANGDNLVLGASNRSGRSTWLASRGPSVLKLNNTAGGTVLDLRNGGEAAPLVVDSGRRVLRLKADKVDGRHAGDLIRVGYDSTTEADDVNGAAATVTIEAPHQGLLVMSGTIDANGISLDDYACGLKVDGTMVTGTQMLSAVDYVGAEHAYNGEENCTTTGVQPVAAGWHTVTLDITGRNTAYFHGASLWAMYVPFDQTGHAPDIP